MFTSTKLISEITNGKYDTIFAKLYTKDAKSIKEQQMRYVNALQRFEKLFGTNKPVAIYSAPGRTEIGGNHTDHNHGLALAAAVNLDIIAIVSQNSDNIIRIKSKGYTKMDEVNLDDLEPDEKEFGKSLGLIRGVAAGILKQGGNIGGFDAYTTSNVLSGSGLSSSAAFEVCLGTIINHEYNDQKFKAVEIGKISQFAENVFFGKPSGLLDQTACAVGGAIQIDFASPQEPKFTQIPFNLEKFGFALVITDTKGSHANLTGEYAAIKEDMQAVAAYFGKSVLQEVPANSFYEKIADIRNEVGDRAVLRAIHFYEECRRVPLLAKATQENSLHNFLQLIIESGNSSFEYNQNAYSINTPKEQGVPLGLAISQKILAGQGAWRLQGGGFAGTIQAFVPFTLLNEYCTALRQIFGQDACYILTVRGQGGTKLLP